MDVHVYSHLDPMDTTWTKGVHVYGCWSAQSGGLVMENDEGCAPPTADVADFEVAARGENSMPAARGGN